MSKTIAGLLIVSILFGTVACNRERNAPIAQNSHSGRSSVKQTRSYEPTLKYAPYGRMQMAKEGPPRIDKTEAIKIATSFLKKVGVNVANNADVAARQEIWVTGRKIWQLHIEKTEVYVLMDTGEVVAMNNGPKMEDMHTNRNRSEERRFSSYSNYVQYLDSLTRGLGRPLTWKLLDSPDKRQDFQRKSNLIGVYIDEPFGYPLFNYPNYFRVDLDAQDGVCVMFRMHHNTFIESKVKKVAGKDAVGKAQRIYEKYCKLSNKKPSDANDYSKSDPKLGFAVETFTFEQLYNPSAQKLPPRTAPFSARLCYKVEFGSDFVFVDAANGKCIGGKVRVNYDY